MILCGCLPPFRSRTPDSFSGSLRTLEATSSPRFLRALLARPSLCSAPVRSASDDDAGDRPLEPADSNVIRTAVRPTLLPG